MINAEEIQATYYRHYEKEAEKGNNRLKRPLPNIRASLIGKCPRQIYNMMVNPQEGIGWYSPEVSMRLKDGERHERWMVIDLQEMGFDIINQQRPIDDHPELKKRNITGHVEFQIQKEKELLPCEIKSMTTHSETSINSAADFDDIWYYRHYPDQAQMYMYGLNAQSITYIIKNKDNSRPNIFDMPLDMERVRFNLDKADLINSCIKAKKPPPRQAWCEECAGCSFVQYCLPDVKGDGKLISLEPPESGIIELLERKNELSEAHKEHERIGKLLKEYWKSILGDDEFKIIIMGDWKIEITKQNRSGWVVDPFSFASAKVEKIGGNK